MYVCIYLQCLTDVRLFFPPIFLEMHRNSKKRRYTCPMNSPLFLGKFWTRGRAWGRTSGGQLKNFG